MATSTCDNLSNLAFVHWQYHANEKAYENTLITKVMYEFAREELRKTIDRLSTQCYSSNKAGDNNGFIKNKTAIG